MEGIRFIATIVITFLLLQKSNGKKILAVEFFGTKSHVFTYLGLLEELSRRGHQVTLVSPLKNFAKDGVKEIFTTDVIKSIEIDYNVLEMKEKNIQFDAVTVLGKLYPPACVQLYERSDILALMEETWDLVILQPLFNECSLGLVFKIMQKSKCPLILFFPASANNLIVSKIGGFHPPSAVPSLFLGLGAEMNFWERMQNLGMEALVSFTVDYRITPRMEAIYREKLGADVPSAKEILGSASILFSNGHFSINPLKPNYPDVIDVGGIHSQSAKPLPKDIEDFISGNGEHGFILLTFGSGVPMKQISKEKREILFNVFGKLKQKVIMKYDGEEFKNVPANVKLLKWLPQQDLLGHPKIKIFITHCGMGGTEEAIFHGVPMLGIPFLGDQPLNAMHAEKQGILFLLDWNELTEESLENGINELLHNPSYQEKVKNLSALFKDQIDNPLDRAVWWTEYVIRHNGAPHLKSYARKLNFFQYHSLDVLGFVLLVLLLVSYICIRIAKFLYSLALGLKSGKSRKNKSD